jgi:hypothetical protein
LRQALASLVVGSSRTLLSLIDASAAKRFPARF